MKIESLQQLITDLNYDQEIIFNIGNSQKLNQDSLNSIKSILFSTDKIKYVCPICKEENPFEVHYKIINNITEKEEINVKIAFERYISGMEMKSFYLTIDPISVGTSGVRYFESDTLDYYEYMNIDSLILYTMKCKHDQSHIQNMILRINAFDGNINTSPSSEDMKTRVNNIKSNLSTNFIEISTELYKLLSLSIHSMNEDDIEKSIELLFKAVMFQLAYENKLLEENREQAEITRFIKSLSSNLDQNKVKK